MSKHELSLVEVTHYTDPEVLAIVKDFHVRGNFASLPEFAERTFVSAVPLAHLEKFENKEELKARVDKDIASGRQYFKI